MPHSDVQRTGVAFGSAQASDTARAEALRTLEAETSLHTDWIVGLATNREAPYEVLRRVFTVDPLPEARYWLTCSRLSPRTAEVAVAHPEARVRAMAAENPYLPTASRAVLAEDPDPRVRRLAVMVAREYGVELPEELTVRLATGPEPRLRYLAAGLPGLPEATLLSLAEDDDPRVRAAAIASWTWPRLRPEIRAAAEADPDPGVREAVRRATHVDAPLPTTVGDFLAETAERRRRDAAATAPVDAALAHQRLCAAGSTHGTAQHRGARDRPDSREGLLPPLRTHRDTRPPRRAGAAGSARPRPTTIAGVPARKGGAKQAATEGSTAVAWTAGGSR
ncbi:HEAT repeat domain-containing protein [Streptomyces sp. JH34]|uniref:HEAT repeat domain-containing protein n=1 Tax=Streptomyces sp. JH34 TaxID=2793633 RepID=UPI0023F80650|nr:HEAT repeat domain-containing protein [Streptomyces sp. JH34]MDF6022966.1 hypothetical protein [Streptomyces sp. JH34]